MLRERHETLGEDADRLLTAAWVGTKTREARGKVRLRWQAERPGALWHADVCHGSAVIIDGKSLPIRIHGILDEPAAMLSR